MFFAWITKIISKFIQVQTYLRMILSLQIFFLFCSLYINVHGYLSQYKQACQFESIVNYGKRDDLISTNTLLSSFIMTCKKIKLWRMAAFVSKMEKVKMSFSPLIIIADIAMSFFAWEFDGS